MLMGTRASSPQPWPVVVGVCGWGAYQNLEDPFNEGDPQILPPLCELVMGYIVPLPFHEGNVNGCKKTHTHRGKKSFIKKKKEKFSGGNPLGPGSPLQRCRYPATGDLLSGPAMRRLSRIQSAASPAVCLHRRQPGE